MKKKLGQILFVTVIGLMGLISVNAQQKDVRVTIFNDTDLTVLIKDVDDKDRLNEKAYRMIKTIAPGKIENFLTKSNRQIIVTKPNGKTNPWARKLIDGSETQVGYKFAKSGNGYTLLKAPPMK